jgi:hypothetical protein
MSLYFVTTSSTPLALVAATAKSALELGTSAATRIKIVEWWVTFDGVTPSNVPVKVEVGRFSAGVTTATSVSDKFDVADGTPATTSKHSTSTEGAGTADDILYFYVPPTGGFHYVAPLGREMVMGVSSFWRMRLTAPNAVNCQAGVIWEE